MKNCGVLLPVFSLPSPYGIGDLGKTAYAFVDFLADAGQSYWQVLPVGPTSYGDSPYQSPSCFAGNPYFIDLEDLRDRGLLTDEETESARVPVGKINYGELFHTRLSLLRKAYDRFTGGADYEAYCRHSEKWLSSYALFCTIKEHFELRPHTQWEKAYRDCRSREVRAFALSHEKETDFYRFLQYTFDTQWQKLKTYCNARGIGIIGDAPIYAAYDSADFWAEPQCFAVGKDGAPTEVAGVPPDYFSADGQLWGNPLYNWDALRASGYDFWVRRMDRALTLFDTVRIDHFRGFCAYYAIPVSAENARTGEWKEGPGKELFDVLHKALPDSNKKIIAEDLGVDAPELRELLHACGYPGMKVVQFGFDGPAAYNAHAVKNFIYDAVGYTGTHDNDTFAGWYASLSAPMRKKVRSRLPDTHGDMPLAAVKALFGSRVRTAIVPMQDWLQEGSEGRINIPGTSEGNWQYRLSALPPESLAEQMRMLAKQYGR